MRPIGTAATLLVRYSHLTPARRAANRANALKSTGPRTGRRDALLALSTDYVRVKKIIRRRA